MALSNPVLPNSSASFKHIPTLDGMRAVSILIVIASHYGLGWIFPGEFGVTIFFFISGFLITRLMIAEEHSTGSVSIGAFYIRRFLRLGPALLTMLLVVSVLQFCLSGTVSVTAILAAIFYLMNYFIIYWHLYISALAPLWSLAVEEHFYFAYPSFFQWAWKRRARFVVVLLALCVAVLLWRTALFLEWNVTRDRIAYGTDTRIDSILYGALLAVILETPTWAGVVAKLDRNYTVVAAGMVLLASFLIRNETFRETIRYSLQGAALIPVFYCVLFVERFAFARHFLDKNFIVWIGRLSYSLYIWHEAVLYFLSSAFPQHKLFPVIYLCGMPLTFGMAALSYYLVEAPFQSIRKILRKRQILEQQHGH